MICWCGFVRQCVTSCSRSDRGSRRILARGCGLGGSVCCFTLAGRVASLVGWRLALQSHPAWGCDSLSGVDRILSTATPPGRDGIPCGYLPNPPAATVLRWRRLGNFQPGSSRSPSASRGPPAAGALFCGVHGGSQTMRAWDRARSSVRRSRGCNRSSLPWDTPSTCWAWRVRWRCLE